MTIWIDADAAPRHVKEIVFRAAKRLEMEAVLVANQPLKPPRHNPHVRAMSTRPTGTVNGTPSPPRWTVS